MNASTGVLEFGSQLLSDEEDADGPFLDELVRYADEIRLDDLCDLYHGRILALAIDRYHPGEDCERLAAAIINHWRVGGYVVDRQIHRFGISFYDTAKDEALLEEYFEEALPTMRDLRQACEANLSPLDRLHVELDSVWPGGAMIARLRGRKMMRGAARVFGDGIEVKEHVDTLGFDAVAFPDAPRLITQISANIYLRCGRGGELALWKRRILTLDEENSLRLPTSKYALDPLRIGPPDVELRPHSGLCVLFDSTRVHAVRKTVGSARVSMAVFAGFAGLNKPLTLWS